MVNDTRARILQAAKTLAESNDSIQGVTISLESVAQAAGLTKPGLMYHFPNKEALMLGLVDHAAQQWHQRLHDHTGSEPVELSAFDRHRAYV
ncbi:TetR/AcrR family transcriptional regulator, partial [Brevibacterium aurantiacum]